MYGREVYLRKAWPIEKEDRKMVWATIIAIWFGLLFLLGLLATWESRQLTWQTLLAAGEQEAVAGRTWWARGHLTGAYYEAVKARSVEGLLLVGDAFARHDWVAHGEPCALKIYLHALHLAKNQGSVERLLQAAERLSRIGRGALAEVAYRAAQDLTTEAGLSQKRLWTSRPGEVFAAEE